MDEPGGLLGITSHLCVGWPLFHCSVVMVCHGVVVALHCSYVCHIALLVTWSLNLGVRRQWRRVVDTYSIKLTVTTHHHCLDDVAYLPCHLCYPHTYTCSVTLHWQVVGVIIQVCCEGCGQSIMADGSGGCW